MFDEPANARQELVGAAIDPIQRDRLQAAVLHDDVGMIVQIRADAWQVMDRR